MSPPRYPWLTRVLLPASVVAATAGLLAATAWRSLVPGQPVRAVPVLVQTIEAPVGSASVIASGWVEPDPFPLYVSALAAGTVLEVPVLEGQRVEKGDVVARLVPDDAELQLARAEAQLAIAEADLSRADAERAACQEILDTLIDRREAVAVADARVREIDARLASQAQAVRKEEAALAILQDELDRKGPLVRDGAVSELERRRLTLAVAAQQALLEAARGEVPVLEAQRARATARRDAARRQLELTIEERRDLARAEAEARHARAAVARAAAARDEARLRRDRMTVHAPAGGVVLRRLVAPGSLVLASSESESAHIVHLYDPRRLQVRVDVPLAEAAAVGLGQRAEVTLQVLPERVFPARVTRVVHRADIQKNTVEVKVAIEVPDPLLKPEMLARVRFLARDGQTESRQRVLVPESCLMPGSRLWVVSSRDRDTGRAELRTVQCGALRRRDAAGASWCEVSAGLQAGDWVIEEPPPDLAEGDRVVIVDASAASTAGAPGGGRRP